MRRRISEHSLVSSFDSVWMCSSRSNTGRKKAVLVEGGRKEKESKWWVRIASRKESRWNRKSEKVREQGLASEIKVMLNGDNTEGKMGGSDLMFWSVLLVLLLPAGVTGRGHSFSVVAWSPVGSMAVMRAVGPIQFPSVTTMKQGHTRTAQKQRRLQHVKSPASPAIPRRMMKTSTLVPALTPSAAARSRQRSWPTGPSRPVSASTQTSPPISQVCSCNGSCFHGSAQSFYLIKTW